MISALTQQGCQYYNGTRYETSTANQGDYFKYEVLIEPRVSYGQIINNLIAIQGRTTIKTNWNIGFKPQQYVVLKDGRKYIIEDVMYMSQEVNPQVAYWGNRNINTDIVLSLTLVSNEWELE